MHTAQFHTLSVQCLSSDSITFITCSVQSNRYDGIKHNIVILKRRVEGTNLDRYCACNVSDLLKGLKHISAHCYVFVTSFSVSWVEVLSTFLLKELLVMLMTCSWCITGRGTLRWVCVCCWEISFHWCWGGCALDWLVMNVCRIQSFWECRIRALLISIWI